VTLSGSDTPDRRVGLRRLDDCLHILEEAHDRGLAAVNTRIHQLLAGRVPNIATGMLIADAIDEVFTAQEAFMTSLPAEPRRRRGQRRRRETVGTGSHRPAPQYP